MTGPADPPAPRDRPRRAPGVRVVEEEAEPATTPEPDAALPTALVAEFGLRRVDEVPRPVAWVRNRQLFTVPVAGMVFFPGFQFDADGTPLPAIAATLTAIADRVAGWELAVWFITANDLLDGRRPVDVLAQPDLLIAAARALVQPDG